MKNDSVDPIITDPPYGIGGEKLHRHYRRKEDPVIGGYIDVPAQDYPKFSEDWIKEAERVLKPGGSIYIVSGYTQLRHILNALAQTCLEERDHIIWKYNFGVYTSRKYISSHYHILYYTKPGGKVTFNTFAFFSDREQAEGGGSANYRDREDVWTINKEFKPGQVKNKNELPKALLAKMILYSSNRDDMVCDFFLGGFSTARTALGLGRRACGFELNKQAFDYQVRQIQDIEYGELLDTLREVPQNRLTNKGKRLTGDEREKILASYDELIKTGCTKKSAIDRISGEFGRGYWSIMNILDRRRPSPGDPFRQESLF